MKTTTICLNCGEEFDFTGASNDELGWHVLCKCDSSYDIDIEDYLITNGTKVLFSENRIGIIDGNDEANTENFENINYYVCPIEFTNEDIWSNHYIMLRRSEFRFTEN